METANQLVLRACMIDGFGPFEEADYRRSWLFFEDVDYIVPHRLSGMTEGMNLDDQLDFQVCREELAPDDLEQLFELTRWDAEDPELRRLIESCIPRSDRDYAAAL